MNTCKNCGAEMEDGARFCPNCGAEANDSEDLVKTGNIQKDGQSQIPSEPKQNQAETGKEVIDQIRNPSEAAEANDTESEKKKGHRNLFFFLLIAAAAVVVIVLAVILGRGKPDQTVVYEGIEFQVPGKWEYNEDESSETALCFYTDEKKQDEALYITAVPDITPILNLFGTDVLMDWITEYVHEQTGGETVDAQKVETAGYETYLIDVTGIDKDADGETVKGGCRFAYILNTDKSEMIVIYALGLSSGEDDQKILTDIDYILENASTTTEDNTY